MKRPITGVVALLAGAIVAYSQGTVSFENYASNFGYCYVSLGSTKLGGSSTGPDPTLSNYASETANGNDWTVALYGNAGWNDPATSLVQLFTPSGQSETAPLALGWPNPTPYSDEVPGTWLSVAVADVPGTTGNQHATVQAYAWYNDGGVLTTWDAALRADVPVGFSSTANIITGGSNPNGPSFVPAQINWSEVGNITLAVAPEPSTIALAAMGASAFLLGLRRKL